MGLLASASAANLALGRDIHGLLLELREQQARAAVLFQQQAAYAVQQMSAAGGAEAAVGPEREELGQVRASLV